MVTALIIIRRLYDIVLNKVHAVGRDFAIIYTAMLKSVLTTFINFE